MIIQPIVPVRDIYEGWAHFTQTYYDDNPISQRTIAKDDKTNNWENFGNAWVEADFLKHLLFRSSFGGTVSNYYFNKFYSYTYWPRPDTTPNNVLKESSGYNRSWTWTNTLSYTTTFGKAHNFKGLLGTEAIENYNQEIGGTRWGYFTNDPNFRFLSNGLADGQSNYSFAGTSSLFSIISQADYNFDEKYFFRATFRRDGSSVFGAENRYGWFPAFSAAWRLTEENFLHRSHWITELKLRASWGKTGFYGNTNPFNQYNLYGGNVATSYYDINGTSNSPVQGFRALSIGDPQTGWQEDIATNIGFESVFWNGKLSVTTDFYTKKATGLLFPVTLPDVLGGASPPNVNVGTVKNSGIDLLINSKGKWSADWRWDLTLTLTSYNNKILKLTGLPYFIPQFPQVTYPMVRNEIGYPVGSFYGYKITGIFQNDDEVQNAAIQKDAAPGRFRYLDADLNDTINDLDRIHFGDPNPVLTAGINIAIQFRNFDFSTFFYGSFGNDVFNIPSTQMNIYSTGNTNIQYMPVKSKAAFYESWTPKNTNTSIPIAENDKNFSNLATANSYGLEDGSYFRNKSLIIGYTLPVNSLKRLRIEKLRIYLQAANLFTITNYTGLDPELSGRSNAFGIDFGNYPNNQRQFLFGMGIVF